MNYLCNINDTFLPLLYLKYVLFIIIFVQKNIIGRMELPFAL